MHPDRDLESFSHLLVFPCKSLIAAQVPGLRDVVYYGNSSQQPPAQPGGEGGGKRWIKAGKQGFKEQTGAPGQSLERRSNGLRTFPTSRGPEPEPCALPQEGLGRGIQGKRPSQTLWEHMPGTPACRGLRQENCFQFEFEACLDYIVQTGTT